MTASRTQGQGAGRISGLDGWRGIAIALVLVSHGTFNEKVADPAWTIFFNTLPQGEDGVRIFFCLSGFLITRLLLREEEKNGAISLRHFYIRRALRILPVYFAYVLAVAALNWWQHWGMTWQNFITPATFSTGFWLRRFNTWVFEHFWSLAVEEVFYLFWPFALALLPRASRLPLAGLLLVGLPIARTLCVGNNGAFWFGFGIVMSLDYLMMGCLAALVYDPLRAWMANRSPGAAPGLQWAGLLLVGCAWMGVRHGEDWGWSGDLAQRFSVGLAVTLMAAGFTLAIAMTSLASGSLLTRILEWGPLAGLGKISYSIYIWQQVILNPSLGEAAAWRRFPFNILLAIGAGWLSYHLFEKWFLKLKERYCAPAAAPSENRPVTPVPASPLSSS